MHPFAGILALSIAPCYPKRNMKEPTEFKFRFSRPVQGGPISVLNEKSYVMATYNQNTGKAEWHRVVAATQRVSIERSLLAQYPISQPS